VISLYNLSQPRQFLMTKEFPSQRSEPEGAEEEGDANADSEEKATEKVKENADPAKL